MLFREHVLSDVLPHLHNKNDNAHKLFFTSSQNSTFSLTQEDPGEEVREAGESERGYGWTEL